MNMINELKIRDLIKDITNEDKINRMLLDGKSVYCGFDPTADSLHVGHLLPLLTLLRLKRSGVSIKPLVGGATGMIGDPSFKNEERRLNNIETITLFKEKIKKQIIKILGEEVSVLDNYNWVKNLTLLDFLRDTGKHFSVNAMIKKDSVKSRIERDELGISFTEFTYQILQSMDFLHLFKNENCSLQFGGSDQWGNITAGIDYIHRVLGNNKELGAFTLPLLLKSDGKKFGKSEGGAVWLDAKKTTPFEFFQFWLNISDEEVSRFFKMLSFRSIEEIEEILKSTEPRKGQQMLAEELTEIVHGKDELNKVLIEQKVLFKQNWSNISETDLNVLSKGNIVKIEIDKKSVEIDLIDMLIQSGYVKSKRIARELITNRSIKINGKTVVFDEDNKRQRFLMEDVFIGDFLLVQKGKKDFFMIVKV